MNQRLESMNRRLDTQLQTLTDQYNSIESNIKSSIANSELTCNRLADDALAMVDGANKRISQLQTNTSQIQAQIGQLQQYHQQFQLLEKSDNKLTVSENNESNVVDMNIEDRIMKRVNETLVKYGSALKKMASNQRALQEEMTKTTSRELTEEIFKDNHFEKDDILAKLDRETGMTDLIDNKTAVTDRIDNKIAVTDRIDNKTAVTDRIDNKTAVTDRNDNEMLYCSPAHPALARLVEKGKNLRSIPPPMNDNFKTPIRSPMNSKWDMIMNDNIDDINNIILDDRGRRCYSTTPATMPSYNISTRSVSPYRLRQSSPINQHEHMKTITSPRYRHDPKNMTSHQYRHEKKIESPTISKSTQVMAVARRRAESVKKNIPRKNSIYVDGEFDYLSKNYNLPDKMIDDHNSRTSIIKNDDTVRGHSIDTDTGHNGIRQHNDERRDHCIDADMRGHSIDADRGHNGIRQHNDDRREHFIDADMRGHSIDADRGHNSMRRHNDERRDYCIDADMRGHSIDADRGHNAMRRHNDERRDHCIDADMRGHSIDADRGYHSERHNKTIRDHNINADRSDGIVYVHRFDDKKHIICDSHNHDRRLSKNKEINTYNKNSDNNSRRCRSMSSIIQKSDESSASDYIPEQSLSAQTLSGHGMSGQSDNRPPRMRRGVGNCGHRLGREGLQAKRQLKLDKVNSENRLKESQRCHAAVNRTRGNR
eukprot:GHVL01033790.1.p1 GENE.GHVL01033790.1~~GHVL01033790.1.p1  ORF type:complete len:709 (-),score=168.67 GHVL01033790.1:131-2257(-)